MRDFMAPSLIVCGNDSKENGGEAGVRVEDRRHLAGDEADPHLDRDVEKVDRADHQLETASRRGQGAVVEAIDMANHRLARGPSHRRDA